MRLVNASSKGRSDGVMLRRLVRESISNAFPFSKLVVRLSIKGLLTQMRVLSL